MSKWDSIKTKKKEEYNEMSIIGIDKKPKNLLAEGETPKIKFKKFNGKYKFAQETISIYGSSTSGKTYLSLTSAFLKGSNVYIIGTEQSTEDELLGSNFEKYKNVNNIFYNEINGIESMNYYDSVELYNTFWNYIYLFKEHKNPNDFLIVDTMSAIYLATNDILRRAIYGQQIKKEQGIPQRFWFWRNTQMEKIMLFLKSLPMHKILIYKSSESERFGLNIKWHGETSKHYSTTILENHFESGKFISKVKKCRKNHSIIGKEFVNLTIEKLFDKVKNK